MAFGCSFPIAMQCVHTWGSCSRGQGLVFIQGSLRRVREFGDPYSTKVPRSSVFEGSLAGNGGRKPRRKRWLGDLSSEGLVLPAHHALVLSYVHFSWQPWNCRDISCQEVSCRDLAKRFLILVLVESLNRELE